MKTLHLPLKSEWYSVIEIGVKKEEYRVIKPHWIIRLLEYADGSRIPTALAKYLAEHPEFISSRLAKGIFRFKKYINVCFSYGYTKRTMT